MFLVRLFNNYTKECCGEKTHIEILHTWEFETYEAALGFYINNKDNYGDQIGMGEWLEHPVEK